MGELARPEYWQRACITHSLADVQRPHWERCLEPYREQVKEVLEVGSYEGQSALFWHHYFGAAVTCIDTWATFASGCSSAEEVEQHFDANVKGFPIFKLKGKSTISLYWLLENEYTSFNLVYIDGDHSPDQVMIDSILAWKCLQPHGIMVWDDYSEARKAINFFCEHHGTKLIEDTYQQLIVQKPARVT